MTTRHARDGEPRQWRYMSSPEYEESAGLRGHLVAQRASLLPNPKHRSLLFFLQALSMRPGGLKSVAQAVVDAFPERIGSRAMHRLRIAPGKTYDAQTVRQIREELFEFGYHKPATGDQLIAYVKKQALLMLPEFLTSLCLDPQVDPERIEKWIGGVTCPVAACFDGIIETLLDFQAKFSQAAADGCAETSIAAEVFDSLNFGMQVRGLVILEGIARIGKSTAAKTFCERNLGHCRYVSLKDVRDDTGFFRSIARALGLPSTYTRKAVEMRDRIEDMLRKSGLQLVLDEAHYLWGHAERMRALPHRLNWILTALCNEGVPVALVATPQFAYKRQQAERDMKWSSEQLRGRTRRYRRLPDAPSQNDLMEVAKRMLPGADKATLLMIVGYALSSHEYMTGIVNAIDEAKHLVRDEGREVTVRDINVVRERYLQPSAIAQEGLSKAPARRQTHVARPEVKTSAALERSIQPLCTPGERALQPL